VYGVSEGGWMFSGGGWEWGGGGGGGVRLSVTGRVMR